MTRWHYKSVYDELEDMRSYMDSLFSQMAGQKGFIQLPAAGEKERKVVPASRTGFRLDVAEHENEVIVTVDMMPGVKKEDISLDLINPEALGISCERREEMKEENEGYFIRERRFGSMTRIVPLPKPVTDEGASATFRNGVLEVRLKKSRLDPKTKIPID